MIGARQTLPSTRTAMYTLKCYKRGVSVQRPVPPPPPNKESDSGWSLSEGRGRTMVIGMLLVGSGFGLFYVGLQRIQDRKEKKDIIAPGHVPTWQYQMKQAGQPVNDSGRPLVPRRSSEDSQDRDQGYSTATPPHNAEDMQITEPAPQRSRADGSGKNYTKRPS